MDIRELVEAAYAMALGKGWWDDSLPFGYEWGPLNAYGGDGTRDRTSVPYTDHKTVAAKLALVHSEVSEALECVRDGQYAPTTNPDRPGKPEGLPSELADVVIRVADLCGALGIDLDEAIRTKMAYNATRTHRHGGRNL